MEEIRDSNFLPGLDKGLSVFTNPYAAWSVLVAYISFCKLVGPTIMKHRNPFSLQWFMIAYNAALVAANVCLSAKLMELAFRLWPHRCDIYSSPLMIDTKVYVPICLLLFYVKFAELFDTVVFVLRKKNNQISFLHIFHHSIVFLMAWIGFKFRFVKYHLILTAGINCSIHVLLYSYYGLSAIGPNVRKYLWWKKYLTKLQIAQFFVLVFYMLFSMFSGCEKFSVFDKSILVFTVIIMALFINFYYQEYKKRK